MIDADFLKNLAKNFGADLCGVALVKRFSRAPEGFRPTDIYTDAQSVVVVARRFPEGAFQPNSPIPYTVYRHPNSSSLSLLVKCICPVDLWNLKRNETILRTCIEQSTTKWN